MRKPNIGITSDFITKDGKFMTPGPGLKLLDSMNVDYSIFPEFLREVEPKQIEGFDFVITFRPLWTSKSLAGNTQLLSVHRHGVGYERLDIAALNKAGVLLCITPNAVRYPMASSIVTFILTLTTRILEKNRLIVGGRWDEASQASYHGMGLAGKVLGSIGVGNIGHEVFRLIKPFGMKHIAYDPFITPDKIVDVGVELVDMDTVLRESDIVNISCPLTEKTRHLISEKELRKMKKTAFLVNAARGAIVDEATLIKALQERWIRGAALDVFETEPIAPDNPLPKMDNVIATPHSICFTVDGFMAYWEEILHQISQILKGQLPDSVVNPEVWSSPLFQAKLNKFLASTLS